MPTYQATSTYDEDGFGTVVDRIVISDTYGGLFAAGTEVNVLDLDSDGEDLEESVGVALDAELTFDLSEVMVETAADDSCVDFVLAAQDTETKRFVARFINPATPPTIDDAAFIGRISAEMAWEDTKWTGPDFSTTIAPIRAWKCSAGSIDASFFLDKKIKDLVLGNAELGISAITDDWIATHVADRLAYFYSTGADGHGHREARWASLVAMQTVLQKLLDQAEGDAGIALTFESTDTDLHAQITRFYAHRLGRNGYAQGTGDAMRYVGKYENSRFDGWRSFPDERIRLKAGGAPNDDGSTYLSWRLFKPRKDEESLSYWSYQNLAGLLYSMAFALCSYVRFTYDNSSAIRIRMVPHSGIVAGEIYFGNAIKAGGNTKPVPATDASKSYRAAAWDRVVEGDALYTYDGHGFNVVNYNVVPDKGEMLPLSCAQTVCILQNRGEDAGVSFHGRYQTYLPHNIVFWDSATGRSPKALTGMAEFNREALTTAIFVRTTGRNDDGSVGVSGMTVWAPICWVEHEKAGRWNALSEIHNQLHGFAEPYFKSEYNITTHGICGFRTTPDGTSDWRNLVIGRKTVLDGAEWTVVGFRRSRRNRDTTLRLQRVSRFTVSTPGAADGGDQPEGIAQPQTPNVVEGAVVRRMPAGEALNQYDIVVYGDDAGAGKLYVASAHHSNYRRIAGIVLTSAAEGELVEVQSAGVVTFDENWAPPAGQSWDAGTMLYLRAGQTNGGNISTAPLLAASGTEDLYVEVGTVVDFKTILVRVGTEFMLTPLVP